MKSKGAIVKVGVVAIAILVAITGAILYSIRSAENRAEMFCEETAVGSNASAAVGRAKVQKILFDSNGGYAFYFPTITGFDKAVCEVSVDKDGKVISKRWEMAYD